MSKLQKEFIRNVLIFFLVIFGIVGLFYGCLTNQIFGAIVLIGLVGGFLLFVFGWIFYHIIASLVKDFKIRGVLNKEEYEFYNMYTDPRNLIWTCDDEDKEYYRIAKILKKHNINL
jgi:hypothetical protein